MESRLMPFRLTEKTSEKKLNKKITVDDIGPIMSSIFRTEESRQKFVDAINSHIPGKEGDSDE